MRYQYTLAIAWQILKKVAKIQPTKILMVVGHSYPHLDLL